MSFRSAARQLTKAIALALVLLANTNEARADLQQQKNKIIAETKEARSKRIHDEMLENILKIDQQQQALEDQARWLDRYVLPFFEQLEKDYASADNKAIESKKLGEDKTYLEKLLSDITTKHQETAKQLLGSDYDKLISRIEEVLKTIRSAQGQPNGPIGSLSKEQKEKLMNLLPGLLAEISDFKKKYDGFNHLLSTGTPVWDRAIALVSKNILVGKNIQKDLAKIQILHKNLLKNSAKLKELMGEEHFNEILLEVTTIKRIISIIANRSRA